MWGGGTIFDWFCCVLLLWPNCTSLTDCPGLPSWFKDTQRLTISLNHADTTLRHRTGSWASRSQSSHHHLSTSWCVREGELENVPSSFSDTVGQILIQNLIFRKKLRHLISKWKQTKISKIKIWRLKCLYVSNTRVIFYIVTKLRNVSNCGWVACSTNICLVPVSIRSH